MVSSCISHMIWGLDEVLTEFLHELCKRLLERCKYTEAQRDLFRQSSDNTLHLTHEPNQSPLQKADSLTLGRESEQWTPSAAGCRAGDMRAACREVLQCSTRWCCILEITLPCGSLYIVRGQKDVANTHRCSF